MGVKPGGTPLILMVLSKEEGRAYIYHMYI